MKNRKMFLKLSLSLAAGALISSASAQSTGQPAAKPAGNAAAPAQLPEVLVTDQGQVAPNTYVTTNATSALKSDVPLLQTAQAVSVVPRSLMDDQGAQKLDDVLKNVAGVSIGNYYAEWDGYRIRGFDVSLNNTYVDGLVGLGDTTEELWGVERVDVVKGPASTLYGQGPLGGMVNLVTKHPQQDSFVDVQATAGSFNFYEAAVDANEILNQSGTVYGRINALYRYNESFVDFAGAQRIYVAPAFTWQITDKTTLTVLTSVKNDYINMAFPLPAAGTVLPNPNGEIPINRYIGNPALGNDEWELNSRMGYELQHEFNEHISLRNDFRYERIDWTSENLSYPDTLDADNRTLSLDGFWADGYYQGFRVDTAVDAKFDTGPVEHTLTGGVDYRWTEQDYTYQNSTNPVSMDVFTPDYDAMPAYQYGDKTHWDGRNDDLGFYVQEHARFWEKFTATVGGRFDVSSSDDATANAFSPKVGLTYEFIKGFAAYANYSKSFDPQWDYTDANGKSVGPSKGENFEAGLKADALEGKLGGLISIYQLTRNDVATSDLSTPDPYDSIVTGQQRSRGVEVEGAYRPLPGLEFTTAYSYIDAKVTRDNDVPVGTPLQGVPKNSFNAWVKYTLQKTALKGLGFGIGGRYYTKQSGDQYDTFSLPSYGVMDLAVYYKRDRFHAQVNINNVLDNRYFVGSYDTVYVLPGDPLNVRASIGWTF